MPQAYGGTLALIAFAAIVVRGLAHTAGAGSTLWAASLAVPVFFLIGCVIGWIADRTVDESIRTKMEKYISADQQAATSAQGATAATNER